MDPFAHFPQPLELLGIIVIKIASVVAVCLCIAMSALLFVALIRTLHKEKVGHIKIRHRGVDDGTDENHSSIQRVERQ